MSINTGVLASSIPLDVTRAKIEEFFSFCGKIDHIEEVTTSETGQVVNVFFASPSAVSTALLLNGAELGGKPVVVSELNDTTEAITSTTTSAIPPIGDAKPDSDITSSTPNEDIEQEHKPKSAIFAEYLAHGYVLSDQLTQKAVEYDSKNGYSDKFKKFLSDIDDKYKIQEKQKEVDSKYQISSKLSKYFDNSQQYVDKAKQTGLGSRLHAFYKGVASDATQIHEEAKRLAELQKKKSGSSTPAPVASSGADVAADAVPTKQ